MNATAKRQPGMMGSGAQRWGARLVQTMPALPINQDKSWPVCRLPDCTPSFKAHCLVLKKKLPGRSGAARCLLALKEWPNCPPLLAGIGVGGKKSKRGGAMHKLLGRGLCQRELVWGQDPLAAGGTSTRLGGISLWAKRQMEGNKLTSHWMGCGCETGTAYLERMLISTSRMAREWQEHGERGKLAGRGSVSRQKGGLLARRQSRCARSAVAAAVAAA